MNAATIYHLHAVFAHSNSNEAIEDKYRLFSIIGRREGDVVEVALNVIAVDHCSEYQEDLVQHIV